jgi:hypothetical protein
MSPTKHLSYFLMTVAVGGLLTGCFSYHRDVRETSTPAVESVPPASSSTTTTTTTNNDGTVERHSTTTYSNP